MGGRIGLRLSSMLQTNYRHTKLSHTTKLLGCYFSSCSEEKNDKCYDIVVVGGGIVGIAAAREIKLRNPELNMCIVEKESRLSMHQTGNNSGVIHSGVYYKPGSLKAKLCVRGMKLSYKYLDKYNVPYDKCGKLIVATNELECKRLGDLCIRGRENKVKDMELVDAKRIKEIEPCVKGIQALHCPHTGIVDWREVALSMACNFKELGGKIFTNFKVKDFRHTEESVCEMCEYPVTIVAKDRCVYGRFVLTCGGLHSDVLAVMSGCKQDPRIIPFRGEYLLLSPEMRHLVKGNIYPVPDPRYPFLGVHFTPRMDGSMWLGPNAVLALKREGYKWSQYDLKELKEVITYPGFIRLATKNISYGVTEMLKSAFMSMQLKEIQKYFPQITIKDIKRGPSGVRAQAMTNKGTLVDDFVFDKGSGPLGRRVLHCRNAPSPACTSSLAIAEVVADRVQDEMDELE